jgi:quercetin dioxygenase-like cupin family protein
MTTEKQHTPKRVVTGHDAEGYSTILFEDHGAAPKLLAKAGGLTLTELWETAGSPADNSGVTDDARRIQKIEPEAGGTLFRLIEYPPDSLRLKTLDTQAHFSSMGVDVSGDPAKRHPGMHKTSTIDYAIILKGEIYAVLDKAEVLLRQGDCIVQRGTHHAWSNRTEESCLIAFVLVSARPLG